jgi:hypothetical protein
VKARKAERDFLAICIASGITEDSARRMLAALRTTARRVRLRHITPVAGVAAVRSLTDRVLAPRVAS